MLLHSTLLLGTLLAFRAHPVRSIDPLGRCRKSLTNEKSQVNWQWTGLPRNDFRHVFHYSSCFVVGFYIVPKFFLYRKVKPLKSWCLEDKHLFLSFWGNFGLFSGANLLASFQGGYSPENERMSPKKGPVKRTGIIFQPLIFRGIC